MLETTRCLVLSPPVKCTTMYRLHLEYAAKLGKVNLALIAIFIKQVVHRAVDYLMQVRIVNRSANYLLNYNSNFFS